MTSESARLRIAQDGMAPGVISVKCKFAPVPRLRWLLPAAAAGALFLPTVAGATSFTTDCSADLDVAACERLTYIAQSQDDVVKLLGWIVGALLILIAVPLLNRTFRV